MNKGRLNIVFNQPFSLKPKSFLELFLQCETPHTASYSARIQLIPLSRSASGDADRGSLHSFPAFWAVFHVGLWQMSVMRRNSWGSVCQWQKPSRTRVLLRLLHGRQRVTFTVCFRIITTHHRGERGGRGTSGFIFFHLCEFRQTRCVRSWNCGDPQWPNGFFWLLLKKGFIVDTETGTLSQLIGRRFEDSAFPNELGAKLKSLSVLSRCPRVIDLEVIARQVIAVEL